VDSESKNVSDVTIELVAELPYEVYLEFKAQKRYEEYGAFSFKLSPKDAEELLKRAVPLRSTTDACGNPLKLRANFTRVKSLKDFLKGREASVDNVGFCASESNHGVTLLRISAPGYVTDYYVGSYLRGCIPDYSFVLSRVEKTSTVMKNLSTSSAKRAGSAERSLPAGDYELPGPRSDSRPSRVWGIHSRGPRA
jgi:hypothetical protein